ncbi:MAG TPA: LLM class flavin-dependent oxidoreductase [Mycobacteriales bacterium]|nr:LLM class flavin-dependent oxidoreductase [Mycobacteriales bacterium]
MRVGVVILPEHRWPAGADLWQRAEAMGFDHAWTYDHLAWRSLRDSTWFGAVPTLAAAASVTTTIRLGPLVASPNLRHPVPFARELLALDDISGGRLVVGLGAGGLGWDATVLGQDELPASARADRFTEFVELTDRLLRAPRTTYHGHYYSAVDAPMQPGCVQQPRPPFVMAGSGPRGMRLAVAYGETWVTTGDHTGDDTPLGAAAGAEVVAAQLARLDDACAEAGRDPSTLGRMVLTGLRLDAGLRSVEAFRETAGRYAEVGVTDLVVHWPRAAEPFAADPATFEAIFGG